MSLSIDRLLFAVAGALAGACVVALFEAIGVSRTWGAPVVGVVLGDVAVLALLAIPVGLAVASVAILFDPYRTGTVRAALGRVTGLQGEARAAASAALLVAPGGTLAWVLVCAHAARAALAQGEPFAAGLSLAFFSVATLVLVMAAGLAAVPVLARTVAGGVAPFFAAGCGSIYALAGAAIGVRLGDASGNGPTPLAVLGVLTRHELDVSPVVALLAIAACAWLGERTSRGRGPGRLAGAAMVVVVSCGLVVHQAYALNDAPDVAHAIETSAPLGHLALSFARRVTDRDHDGASALFGGGDCDDADPRRSPLAVEIPGNGIDEDCSGADLPAPRPAAPSPEPRRATFPHGLNLVLVTIDTLRIDLGFMGYPLPVSPNLDALAARSTVFERAYSMASYTGKSVGPTMIGKYPSECLRDGAHFDTYSADNTLLAERLQAAGFRTMGAASHWYFKPKYGLAQGMDAWDLSAKPPDSMGDADSAVTSAQLTDAAIGLLSDPDTAQRRFFLWVHYFDPHATYVPHPEAPNFRPGSKNWAKPLYDGEVWFTDHHLGRLLDFIASQPYGGRTAIVITADHGETFDEHGMNWHGVDLWEPLVRVPLIVYVPGVTPHRVTAKRSLIDLVPTVLDLMNLPQPPPGELSGESTALAVVSPDDFPIDERDVYIDMPAGPQVSQHRALIRGQTPGLKLLSEGGPVYLLFDLAQDPGELNNLSRDRARFGPMKAAFDDELARVRSVPIEPAR